MADLINRQMAIDTIADYERDSTAPIDYKAIIKALPTVDAVEVVRCNDCKHSYDTFGGLICSYMVCVDCVVRDDFYCAYAERKEDGQTT